MVSIIRLLNTECVRIRVQARRKGFNGPKHHSALVVENR